MERWISSSFEAVRSSRQALYEDAPLWSLMHAVKAICTDEGLFVAGHEVRMVDQQRDCAGSMDLDLVKFIPGREGREDSFWFLVIDYKGLFSTASLAAYRLQLELYAQMLCDHLRKPSSWSTGVVPKFDISCELICARSGYRRRRWRFDASRDTWDKLAFSRTSAPEALRVQKAIHAVAHLRGALRRPDASSPSSRVAPSPQAELQSFSPSVGAAAEAADSALRAAVDLRACLRAVARALKKHPFPNRGTETPRPGEKTDYSVKFLDNWLQQRRDYVCARGERPPGPKLVLLARLTSRGKSVVTTAPVVVPANRPWLTMSAGETLEGYEPVPVSGGAHQSLPFAMLSKLKPRSVCHATGDVCTRGLQT